MASGGRPDGKISPLALPFTATEFYRVLPSFTELGTEFFFGATRPCTAVSTVLRPSPMRSSIKRQPLTPVGAFLKWESCGANQNTNDPHFGEIETLKTADVDPHTHTLTHTHTHEMREAMTVVTSATPGGRRCKWKQKNTKQNTATARCYLVYLVFTCWPDRCVLGCTEFC